ncbi:MAG TPA: PepSY domain-containing protein [Pseudomonas sp.]|nr:PepSY domain-containing protein [Pseudomonas sp.]
MHKTLALLFLAGGLALGAGPALADDRDVGLDEAERLREAGTIQSFEALNEAILAEHPGARMEDTELEEENGRFIYKVEVRDAQNQQWDLKLDAATGEILENRRDD